MINDFYNDDLLRLSCDVDVLKTMLFVLFFMNASFVLYLFYRLGFKRELSV